MSAETNKINSFRWPIVNFCMQWNTRNFIQSSTFVLKTCPNAQFALFFNPKLYSVNDGFFGIELKQYGDSKPIEIKAKFWLENQQGQRFGERFYEKQVFTKVADQCGFSVDKVGRNRDFFSKVYNSRETLFVCCELLELNANTAAKRDDWSFYEQEIHCAIIKIGDVEFKVSKFPLMAYSDVFKQIFLSKSKEDTTIEIKDISKDTMKELITWFYTQQIENESSIEELLIAADNYQISLLKQACIEKTILTLNNKNVLPRLASAILHNNGLKDIILERINCMSKVDLADCLASPEGIEFYRKNIGITDEVLKLVHEKIVKK